VSDGKEEDVSVRKASPGARNCLKCILRLTPVEKKNRRETERGFNDYPAAGTSAGDLKKNHSLNKGSNAATAIAILNIGGTARGGRTERQERTEFLLQSWGAP